MRTIKGGSRTVKVFPDHLSTGLWEDGKSITEADLNGVVPHALLIGLKYWHQIWELHDSSKCFGQGMYQMSPDTYEDWRTDGEALVAGMNNAAQEFIESMDRNDLNMSDIEIEDAGDKYYIQFEYDVSCHHYL